MEKIAVVGFKGKMGSLITKELQKNYDVVGVGKEDDLEKQNEIDLLIDFASSKSSVASAEYCLKKNIPIIIGSTGQIEEENKRLEEISNKIKVVKKANFSMGIKVLENFVESVLNLKPEKFEIIEKHHKNKKDSPSGTALELKNFIMQMFDGEVEIKSIREGEEMGEHEIIAYLGNEKLSIKHKVYSRDVFVLGVVDEVKNLLN